MATATPSTGSKRKRSQGSTSTPTTAARSTSTPSQLAHPNSASGQSLATHPALQGSSGSSPSDHQKRKKHRGRKQRSSMPADPYHASPHATPSSTSKHAVLTVEYRCLNGKSWTVPLDPKAALADLSYDAAKRSRLQETGVRLVYKRGPGQEQDIYDDYDLSALRARASANPRVPIVIMVYPAAGPSSGPSPSPSSSDGYDSPPSTPSHVNANDETQDLYYTPTFEPSNHIAHHVPPTSTTTAASGKAIKPNRKDRRRQSVGANHATPTLTPATPDEPSSARSVRFANGPSTPQWHSTPVHMRPPTHLKHLHQPMRPSPLAQSSRAESDAESEVDVDLGMEDDDGEGTLGVSAAPSAPLPQTSSVTKKRGPKKKDTAGIAASGSSGSPASATVAGPASTPAAFTDETIPATASPAEKKERGPKKKETAVPPADVQPADAIADAELATSSPAPVVETPAEATAPEPKKRGRPPEKVPAVADVTDAADAPPVEGNVASTVEAGVTTVAQTPARGKKGVKQPMAAAAGSPGADTPSPIAGIQGPADTTDAPPTIKRKRKAKEIETPAAPAPGIMTEADGQDAEAAISATSVSSAPAKKAPKGRPAKAKQSAATSQCAASPSTPASVPADTDRAAFLRQMAEDVLRDIAAQAAARRGQTDVVANAETPSDDNAPADAETAIAPATSDNTGSSPLPEPPAKKKAAPRRKSQVEVEIPAKSPAKTPSRPAAEPTNTAELAGPSDATAAATEETPAPKKRGRPKKVVAVEITSPSKRATTVFASEGTSAQNAQPDDAAVASSAPKKRAPRKSKTTAPVDEPAPVAAESNGNEVALTTEEDVPSVPAKKARKSAEPPAIDTPSTITDAAQVEQTGVTPTAVESAQTTAAVTTESDNVVATAEAGEVAADVPPAKKKGGRKSASAKAPAVEADEVATPVEIIAQPVDAENSETALPLAETRDDADLPGASEPAPPVIRNELLAVREKKQPRKACCVICGVKSTHMQQRCPIVKEGVPALEDRLQVVRKEMEGRDKECSEEAIERWIKELKERDDRLKAKAQAKGPKKVEKASAAERVADTPESEEGSCPSGEAEAGSLDDLDRSAAGLDNQNAGAAQSDSPAGDGNEASAPETSSNAAVDSAAAVTTETQAAADVTAGPSTAAESSENPPAGPSATPRPAASFAHVPRFGFDDPTETPLPPYLQNFNKKGRKQGSVSGVSATTAAIETEKSASESESDSDSDASGSSRSSRSRSYSSSADSEGSADRVRVKSAEVDDRIRQEEDEEMGSDADEGDSEGASGDDESSDAEAPAAPTSQRTPTVYRSAKPPNTGHLSDTSDDEGDASSGQEDSGSDSDSDEESDRIASPTNMPPPRKSLHVEDDPNDPEAMFKAVFSKPLSQVKRAEVQARAARMSDVHLQPRDGEDEDDESVDSSSEGDQQQRFRGDSESVIGDFGDGGSEAGDEVEEPESQVSQSVEPPVIERERESIETEADTTPKANRIPLDTAEAEAETAGETTPPPPTQPGTSANTPSRRRFTDLEASAGPSQEVDNLPGAIALEEARSEEDQAENDAMLPSSSSGAVSSTPAIAIQLAQSQPSPRRTRGSQRIREVQSASQPAIPVKAASAPQSQQTKRTTRLTATRSSSQTTNAKEGSAVNGGSSQSAAPDVSTPRPKRVASQLAANTEPSPVNEDTSDQEDQLDSSPRPVTPEPTPRRSGRRTPSVTASPAQGTRRSIRLRSTSVDPIVPESSQSVSQETQETPLFMSQSQPLYTQAYKLMPDSLESGSSAEATTAMGRKTPAARRIRPSSPIAEEDESASTPRANGSHVPETSPVTATGNLNGATAANGSPRVHVNGSGAQAPSELDDGFTEGDSLVFTPIQRSMSQPQPLPPVSFAPSLGSLNMDQLRRGGATLAGYLGFGSQSQKGMPSQRASLPSQASQDAFGMDDSESEADLDTDDEEESTPHVGKKAKALARYASAKDSAVKPKTRTGGRMSGW